MDKPYLQITLNDINEVPKVFYKGKEIEFKEEVLLHWKTDNKEMGGTTITIKHWDDRLKPPIQKTIIEKTLGRAK